MLKLAAELRGSADIEKRELLQSKIETLMEEIVQQGSSKPEQEERLQFLQNEVKVMNGEAPDPIVMKPRAKVTESKAREGTKEEEKAADTTPTPIPSTTPPPAPTTTILSMNSTSPSSPLPPTTYAKEDLGLRIREIYTQSPFFLKPLFIASLSGLNPTKFTFPNGTDDDLSLAIEFEKLDAASKMMFVTQMEAFEAENEDGEMAKLGEVKLGERMNLTEAILRQIQEEDPNVNITVFEEFTQNDDISLSTAMKMGEEVVKSLDSTLNASEVSDISADISSILQGFDEERLEGTSMMIEGLIPDCITESVFGEELWEKVKGDISKIWMITDFESVPGGYVLKGRPTLQPLTNQTYTTLASEFSNIQSKYAENKLILSVIEEPFISEEAEEAGITERDPAIYVGLIDTKYKNNGILKTVVNGFSLLTLAGFSLGVLAGNEPLVQTLEAASKLNPGEADVSAITGLAEQTFAGISGILVGKEVVKSFIANIYGVELAGPLVLPSFNFGCLGAVRRMKGQVDGRGEIFDLGFGSAAVGFGLSLGFLLVGLNLPGGEAVLPAGFLRSSALAGGIVDFFLPDSLTGPDPMAGVHLQPLAVVGFTGIITTALNCLPIGQTDGGRVTTALFGRQAASIITAFTLLVCFIIGLFGNDIILFYAAIAAITQREMEVPARNEIDEVDNARGILGILGIFIVMLSILPLPVQTPY